MPKRRQVTGRESICASQPQATAELIEQEAPAHRATSTPAAGVATSAAPHRA